MTKTTFLGDGINLNKINSNSVSLAGEFAVLSQLALHGFNANMTLGNTKGVDILVSDPRNNKMYKLEVKTNLRNTRTKPIHSKLWGEIISTWIMNKKNGSIIDPSLFYCFVNIEKETNKCNFYIVPSEVVAKYIRDENNLYLREHGVGENDAYPNNAVGMRNFRLGLKGCQYKIDTPTKEDYENNWSFTLQN